MRQSSFSTAAAAFALALAAPVFGQGPAMTFFVTSAGSGKGADFGGLAGADRHCEQLAAAAGAGGKNWHAYLSTTPAGDRPGVDARDRIGRGPWQNAKGDVVAKDVAELHGRNNLSKETSVTERGDVISGRGDPVNQHDILTGSRPDGTAYAGAEDSTCGNWTKSGAEGSTRVGHHDRIGLKDDDESHSWNSSHATKGCSVEGLKSTGGAGLLYCFSAR